MGKDSSEKGSYMVGGRTYRNVITTNEQKPVGSIESQKLNVITTAIIPNALPQAEPKGTDLSKMITTHDERDVEDMSKDNAGAKAQVRVASGEEDAKPVSAPSHKKPGRPKKAE